MTNKRKKRTRALAAKLHGTFQTAATFDPATERAGWTGGAQTLAERQVHAPPSRVLADMTEDTTHGTFRDVPELLPYLLNNELDAIAQTH